MKLLRFRLRTWLILIAVIAFVLAFGVKESKRRKFQSLAAQYASREAYWQDQEKAMRQVEAKELGLGRPQLAALVASQALYNQDQARYFAILREKYERASQNPLAAIEDDPLAPSKYPKDYLSQVPYYDPTYADPPGAAYELSTPDP